MKILWNFIVDDEFPVRIKKNALKVGLYVYMMTEIIIFNVLKQNMFSFRMPRQDRLRVYTKPMKPRQVL